MADELNFLCCFLQVLGFQFTFHAIVTFRSSKSKTSEALMGSEGLPAVTIHVTGFKKFHGVAENPTETIVSNLKEYMKKKGMPKGVILGSCSVLETAGQGAVAPLYQIFQSSINSKDSESSSPGRIIWVSSIYLFFHISASCILLVWLLPTSYVFCIPLDTVFANDSFSYTLGSIVGQQDLPLSIKLSMKLLFAVQMSWDGSHRLDKSLSLFF